MTLRRLLVTDDGAELELELPGAWRICDRCRGEGQHTNPAIDGHGITAEEWWGPDWDDESRELYMTGGYDVACSDCHGTGKVLEVDVDRVPPELAELLQADDRARLEIEAEARYWARLEGGL